MPIENVTMGKDVTIPYPELVNLYGCKIGDGCFVGPFVEIQSDVTIGARTRVQSHVFICSKAIVGEDVFIGHGVMFVNDRYPVRSDSEDWETTLIEDKVVIGSNSTILPCRIGEGAMVGAGAVVTKDVLCGKIVVGNPAVASGDRE